MSIAILITIISSISWGLFDGIRKHLISKLKVWTLLLYLSCFYTLLFAAWAFFSSSFIVNPDYWFYGAITVLVNFLANFFYIQAIRVSDISSCVPFLAFTSLFTAASGFLVLGETLKPIQILGIVILVIASFFINFKPEKSFLKENKGALLMILVSLLWALSAPFDKLAVSHANVITHSFLQSALISIANLVMVIMFAKDNIISDLKQAPRFLIAGSAISALALSLQFWAYTLMEVSIFESLKRAIAIITAFIVSSIFFQEKLSVIKLIATSFIILGAVLILNN